MQKILITALQTGGIVPLLTVTWFPLSKTFKYVVCTNPIHKFFYFLMMHKKKLQINFLLQHHLQISFLKTFTQTFLLCKTLDIPTNRYRSTTKKMYFFFFTKNKSLVQKLLSLLLTGTWNPKYKKSISNYF